MDLIASQDVIDLDGVHIDHFGMSIGSVSVGIPPIRTADDVYRRYLDLVGLLGGTEGPGAEVSVGDLAALARATGVDPDFVARRLAALGSVSVSRTHP